MADYPFTTLQPVLGTLQTDDRQLVIADIPGLIEGASSGAGLGHEFLAHIERTRLLVHVLDVRPLDGSDPVANHHTVERELAEHDPRLAALPRVLALSKADLVDAQTGGRGRWLWQERLGPEVPVVLTSSVSGAGLRELAGELLRLVSPDQAPAGAIGSRRPPEPPAELAEHRVFRPAAGRAYRVTRIGERSFRVAGAGIERLVARYDLDNDEAMAHVECTLERIGVIRALEEAGFEPGDDVEIGGVVFELHPDV